MTRIADWSGGAVDSGTFTGTPFFSHFIRAPNYNRPPRGLLSFYHDAGTDGIFNEKNSTQRLGHPAYFTFTFLPPLLSIFYGRLWKALDDDVKRIDMYYRLQKPGGVKGMRSVCLNYHQFWAPLSIIQAIRYQHWIVAVSSIGSVLGGVVIPVLGNYVFFWALYSGAMLDWPGIYSWQVALVDRDWTYRLVGVLGAAWVCSCVLLLVLPRRATGLSSDVRGITGILSLLSSKTDRLDLDEKNCRSTALEVSEMLGESFFFLERMGTRIILRRTTSTVGQERRKTSTFIGYPVIKKLTDSFRQCAHILPNSRISWRRIPWRRLDTWTSNPGNFFPLRPEIFLLWLCALFTLLVFGAIITGSLNKNAKNLEWNYKVPVNPNIYLIVGVFIQARKTSLILSPKSLIILT